MRGRGLSAARSPLHWCYSTASLRGNTTTAAFSAAKFALRSLSQSLNKEFGKENMYVPVSLVPLFFFFSMPCVFIDDYFRMRAVGDHRRRHVYFYYNDNISNAHINSAISQA
jgi:hypothetical protein